MARKSPFKNVRVGTHILEALEQLRQAANRNEFRALSVNAFCEKILWDYAQGKLSRAESTPTGGKVAVKVEGPGYPHLQEFVADKDAPASKDVHKKNHPRK